MTTGPDPFLKVANRMWKVRSTFGPMGGVLSDPTHWATGSSQLISWLVMM
jgi:hypothetical protein